MRFALAGAIFCCLASAAPRESNWVRAAAPHFNVYSDTAPESARSLATGFERLRAFFLRQVNLEAPPAREVRVICFASIPEYNTYRLNGGASAFYVGSESRDYIVLPAPASGDLQTAAHEYGHLLIHSGGWNLPDWLAEGLGDVASTVHISDRQTRIGGDLPGRSRVLKTQRWLTLAELFAFSLKVDTVSERASLFYAQSWALTDLLMLSPSYSALFPALLAALTGGVPPVKAFDAVYHVSLDALERDLRAHILHSSATPVPLPSIPGTAPEVRVESLAPFTTRLLLADLRLASGDLSRAGSDFAALAAERPDSADVHAALGALALRRGDTASAVASWKRAIELGVTDPDLCFRYAALADDRGLPAVDALHRAIELRPDFDDARFKLALLEKNSGHPEAALAQLRAMRRIAPFRAFAYWIALADCNLDLDRRAEARQAALQAREHAASNEERQRADDFVWMADSELAVEISGPNQFRTIRVPVKAPPRNPFIEAGDRARQAEGTLREVQCPEGGGIQLLVDTPNGALTLSAGDISRVQIRNGGGEKFEFTCGPQDPRKVLVEYDAGKSLLRGIEFK